MDSVETALLGHAFDELFVEHLGWDRVKAAVSLECRGTSFVLSAVAHKRGFTVFSCLTHRTVVADRHFLRDIQRQLRKTYHEHIIVFHCDAPPKQVWAWAFAADDKRAVEHREHPFFSDQPPPLLLQRLHGLAFRLEEEASITLVDAISRVRQALVPESEFNLFAKWPGYARKTERLALAYRDGDASALPRIVEMHLMLAKKWSWLARAWFGLDKDDAGQIAVLGLIEAARRFDPTLGYQFSTYAVVWIRQACSREGLEASQFIQIPSYLHWPSARIERAQRQIERRHGPTAAACAVDRLLAKEGIQFDYWHHGQLARELRLAVNLPKRQWKVFHLEDTVTPVDALELKELQAAIHEELGRLPARDADVLRKRFGLDGPVMRLREIAKPLGLTRERIRQIQRNAMELLRGRLAARGIVPEGIDVGYDSFDEDEESFPPASEMQFSGAPDHASPSLDAGGVADDSTLDETGTFDLSSLQREMAFDDTEAVTE